MTRSSPFLLIVLLLAMSCAVEPVNVFAADEPDIYALYINLDGHGGFTVDPESPWGPGYGEVYVDFPMPDPDFGGLRLYEFGTVVTVTIIGDGISNTTNTRYFYHSVTGYGDGGYTGADQRFQVTMISDIEEAIQWRTQYQITFAQSGITDETGANTVVTIDGVAKTKAQLPFTGWFDILSEVTFTYSTGVLSPYHRHDLSSIIMTHYDASGNLISSTAPTTFTVTGLATITASYTSTDLALDDDTDGSVGVGGSSSPTGTDTGDLGILSIFSDAWGSFSGGIGSWISSHIRWNLITAGFWRSMRSFWSILGQSIIPFIPNWIILLIAITIIFLVVYKRRRDKH